jgi:hypothetical protein
LNASVNNASGKESPAAPSPGGRAARAPASPTDGDAFFGDAARAAEDALATLRGCGNANPFFVFGAEASGFAFDAPPPALDALACAAADGPPKTPRDWFVACPHPPAADAIGRTGHTPPVRGAGTRGVGMDATFAAAALVAALEAAAEPAAAAGALALPKLGHALATGTPTPMALGGGGPAGGAGAATLGAGMRAPPAPPAPPVGNGAGIELKLDARSSVAPSPSDATLVASWKL